MVKVLEVYGPQRSGKSLAALGLLTREFGSMNPFRIWNRTGQIGGPFLSFDGQEAVILDECTQSDEAFLDTPFMRAVLEANDGLITVERLGKEPRVLPAPKMIIIIRRVRNISSLMMREMKLPG